MLALIEAKRAGLFKRAHWIENIIAGVIVGVVALPLAMAFAIASGVKPEQGIYTAIIAAVVVSVFGGSRLQIAGPTGAFIVVLAGITAKYGFEGLQIATLMAGVILLLFGLTKMGSMIKFIPAPVILGFTAGIGVIIFVGQLEYFFGLPEVKGEHFHNKIIHLWSIASDVHWSTTLLAALSLFIVVFSSKIRVLNRVPGPLTALVVVTLLHVVFQFEGIKTIGSAFGGIPQGLPPVKMPDITSINIIDLIGPAFTIAMLGAIESLLSAVVADGMAGTRHDSNQELVGQGLANIIVPFFGGFAATGAIARTATNIRNGGTSPLSGVVHSLTLLVILLLLAPYAVHIPLAVLAAILFVVAWNMSEAKHFLRIVQTAPRADVVILLITFGLTVFADLVVAVNIGVILSMLHFLRRMASSVEVRSATTQEITQELGETDDYEIPHHVQVFTVEGPLFFAAVENFDRALSATHSDPQTLIIRLKWVPFIDITGLQTLEEVITDFQGRGVKVLLAGANDRVYKKFARAGILDLIGLDNYYAKFNAALATCREYEAEKNAESENSGLNISEVAKKWLETSRSYLLSSEDQRDKGK